MEKVINIQDFKNKKEHKKKMEEELIIQREYDEFIKLLKYFLDIQEPKIKEVYVTALDNGSYELKDVDDNKIYNEYFMEDIISSYGSVNYDDLLMSTLITLAPRKIIINNSNSFTNKELLNTIIRVFDMVELKNYSI